MKIRLGNDFAHVWVVERLGEPENLDAARDIEMYLRSANGSVPIAFAVQDGNKIRTQFTAANVPAIGDYSLLLTYIGSDSNRHTLDLDAFRIVSSSAKADQVDEFTSTSEVAIGLRGADAFEVWQSQAGNEGKTYEEYIAYLREPMTLAIAEGNDTAAEWAVVEAERVANELIREENEEERRAAELIREQVKDATIAAKNEAIQTNADIQAEETIRATAETGRVSWYNSAVIWYNGAVSSITTALSNIATAIGLSNTATQNANTAADLANEKAGEVADVIELSNTATNTANAKAILADTAATNANTVATNVANAEAARVLAGSEVKTNKTSDIESNKTSTEKYTTPKGVVDYVQSNKVLSSYTHSGNKEVVVQSIDFATGIITSPAHGLANGTLILVANNFLSVTYPNAVLPTGIAYYTWYYVVGKAENTFKLSLSTGGTAISISDKATKDYSKWHFEIHGIYSVTIPTVKKCRILISGKMMQPLNHTRYVIFYSGGNPILGSTNPVWFANQGRYSNYTTTTTARTLFDFFATGNIMSYYDILVDFSATLATIIINGVRISSTTDTTNTITTITNQFMIHGTEGNISLDKIGFDGIWNGNKIEILAL